MKSVFCIGLFTYSFVELKWNLFLYMRYCRLAVADYGFTFFFCFTTYYPEAPSAWLILTPIYKVDMQIDGHVSSQGTDCPNFRHGRTWKLEVAMVNWPEPSSAPLSSRTQVHRVLCYAEWSLLVGVWVEAAVRGGRRLRAGSRTRTRRLATGHRQPPRTSTRYSNTTCSKLDLFWFRFLI